MTLPLDYFTFLGKSYDKAWSDSLCANIGSVTGTIQDLKDACKRNSGCTAINFCGGGRIRDSIQFRPFDIQFFDPMNLLRKT